MSKNVIAVNSSSRNSRTIDVGGFRVTDAEFGVIRSGRHEHERILCSVTLAGGWSQAFDRNSFDCTVGSALIKPAGTPHRDHFERAGARLVLIEVESGRAAQLEPCGALLREPRLVTQPFIAGFGHRLVAELATNDSATPLAIEGLVLEFFAAAGRRANEARPPKPPPWLRAARDWLDAYFQQPVCLADLARLVGVHPIRLARAFPRHFGVSLGDYVRRARLQWVALQLVTSDAPVAALAQQAGFSDQSHLNRWFRRHLGTTPARYREAARRGDPRSRITGPEECDPF